MEQTLLKTELANYQMAPQQLK